MELEQIGVDSLIMVRVLVLIEERYGVWLEDETLTPESLRDVESIAECIIALIEAGAGGVPYVPN